MGPLFHDNRAAAVVGAMTVITPFCSAGEWASLDSFHPPGDFAVTTPGLERLKEGHDITDRLLQPPWLTRRHYYTLTHPSTCIDVWTSEHKHTDLDVRQKSGQYVLYRYPYLNSTQQMTGLRT